MIRDFTVATTAIFVGTYVAIMAAVVTVGVLRDRQKKKSYRSCSFDSSGWTVNFTKFSVHLHFSKRIGGLQVWINLMI